MNRQHQQITRVWHGRTSAEDADRYLEFITSVAVPDYRSVDGNLSVEIWRRVEDEVCHFWTVTKWASYESIRKFAGDDVERAKYYPEDTDFLLEHEEKVIHCETFRFE